MDGTRSALIVASYDYQDPGLRRLRAPAGDAEALARVLRDPAIGGFEVRTMLNEPSYVVNEAVEEFFDERGRDDLLLLHFSCHGVKDEGGELYFATANTKLRRLGATAVAADFVNRRMSRSRSRRVVLLLDCCYAGAFERGIVARAGAGVDIEEQFGGRGRAVITASSAMEYAFEGDQLADTQALQPSVFTSALVQGLETGEADRDQDGYIDLDELYDYVYDRVREVTPNQTPGKWTFAVQGELYIARRSQPVTTPAALPPELQQVIDHPIPSVRASAVQELQRLLESRHAGLALAARLALEQLVDDDSRMVSAAATAALAPGSDKAVAEPSERLQPNETEVSDPALAVSPPEPQQASSLPAPTAPRTPPEKVPATEEDDTRSVPTAPAKPTQTSMPTRSPQPISTKLDETVPPAAPPAAAPPIQPARRAPTEAAETPEPRQREGSVGKVRLPPGAAGTPGGTRPSPGGDKPTSALRRRFSTRARALTGVGIVAGVVLVIWLLNTVFAPPPPTLPTGTIVLHDSFSTKSHGWRDDGQNRTGGHYKSGVYRMFADPDSFEDSFPLKAREAYPTAFSDLLLEVHASTVGQSDEVAYGILCRSQPNDGRDYYFLVYNDGYAVIGKDTSRDSGDELAHGNTDQVNTESSNFIQAMCTSDEGKEAVRLALWVNGDLVAFSTDNDGPLPPGAVGLETSTDKGAKSPTEVEFDDFVLKETRPTTGQSSSSLGSNHGGHQIV